MCIVQPDIMKRNNGNTSEAHSQNSPIDCDVVLSRQYQISHNAYFCIIKTPELYSWNHAGKANDILPVDTLPR